MIESYGKEYAIKYWKDKIIELSPPLDFEEQCIIAGCEIALEFCEIGQEGMGAKAMEIIKKLKNE